MNLTLHALAATAALLAVPTAPQDVRPETATFIVRYDPETIYLTDSLVDPLMRREVAVDAAQIEGAPAFDKPIRLTLVMDEGNDKQPPGVYIARAVAHRAGEAFTESSLSPQIHDAAIQLGLDQLRSALHERLVRARSRRMQDRLMVLSMTQEKTQDQLKKLNEEIAAHELRARLEVERKAAETELNRLDLEVVVAQQGLTAGVRALDEAKMKLEAQSSEIEVAIKDLETRLDQLVDSGVLSKAEGLQQVDQKRADAAARLAGATARVDLLTAEVGEAERQVDATARRMNARAKDVARLEAEADRLVGTRAGVEAIARAAELSLTRDALVAQARETARETLALEARLATIGLVTVERW